MLAVRTQQMTALQRTGELDTCIELDRFDSFWFQDYETHILGLCRATARTALPI